MEDIPISTYDEMFVTDQNENEDEFSTPINFGKSSVKSSGIKKTKRVTFADEEEIDPYATPLKEGMNSRNISGPSSSKKNSNAWITVLSLIVIIGILSYLGYKWFIDQGLPSSSGDMIRQPPILSTPFIPTDTTSQSFAFGTPNVLNGLQDFRDLELL